MVPKGSFWQFDDKLRYFSRRKLKFLSETCKKDSITVLKIRLVRYKYRRLFRLKSVSRLALRQRWRRWRRRTCLWELWRALCYHSTFSVFLVTLLNFHEKNLNQIFHFRISLFLSLSPSLFRSLFLFLSFSLWVFWGSRGIRWHVTVCKFVV